MRAQRRRLQRVAGILGDGHGSELIARQVERAARDFAEASGVPVEELLDLTDAELNELRDIVIDQLARDIVRGDEWNSAGELMAPRSVDVWAREVGLDLRSLERSEHVAAGLYPPGRGEVWCALDRRCEELRDERRRKGKPLVIVGRR